MASTTFLDLCQLLRAESGTQGTGPATVVSQTGIYGRFVEWTQQAYQEILRMHPWRFLWVQDTSATVNGQSVYTSFAGVSNLGRIWRHKFFETSDGNRRLEFMPFDKLDELPTASGRPSYFSRRPDDAIVLYPTPDDAYTLKLDYQQDGHVLTANTDEPLIPDVWLRDIIMYRALQHYAIWNEDASTKALADSGFFMRLGELHAKYGPQLVTRPIALDQEVNEAAGPELV